MKELKVSKLTPKTRKVIEVLYNSADPLTMTQIVDLSQESSEVKPTTRNPATDFSALSIEATVHWLHAENGIVDTTFSQNGEYVYSLTERGLKLACAIAQVEQVSSEPPTTLSTRKAVTGLRTFRPL